MNMQIPQQDIVPQKESSFSNSMPLQLNRQNTVPVGELLACKKGICHAAQALR